METKKLAEAVLGEAMRCGGFGHAPPDRSDVACGNSVEAPFHLFVFGQRAEQVEGILLESFGKLLCIARSKDK